MSWEVSFIEKEPCRCGAGFIETINESDDWGRFRSSLRFYCARCEGEHREAAKRREEHLQQRRDLLSQAIRLATERYLSRWLALFDGKSKKAAWLIYTRGQGYPSLATFYDHVRPDGLTRYMTSRFDHDLEKVLQVLGVVDADVQALLVARDSIPDYREPHPWQ